MTKIWYQPWLVTAMALLCLATTRGETTAQTDLATITVTPLTRQAGAKADWQTIYDYTGGAPPPGTRITSEGKWIDPVVRQEQTGVTFGFPNLPDSPENAQYLHIAFGFDRPLANYPTRATISYTSFFDQGMPTGTWNPFTLRTDNDERTLFGNLTGVDAIASRSDGKHSTTPTPKPAATGTPLKLVGDNTLVVLMNGESELTINMNGQDATDFFGRRSKGMKRIKPTAMLMNGLSLYNNVTQFPHNKGDWFAVHAFKIEQMRPPLEDSSEAAVDLTVPGSEPIKVTVEVVDAWNDSRGYVLRDALVSPGKYRLYWDGIDQKGLKPEDSAWIGSGSYTFRLTTSKTAMHYAGEINNSAPKYTSMSYMLVNATALTITPPGTPAPSERSPKWSVKNNADDTRKIDTTDSVQMLSAPNDAAHGQWIAADGAVLSTEIGNIFMQDGRGLAMTPPDPSDPTNPEKQFYFASMSWQGGNAIISDSFRTGTGKSDERPQPKTLTSPDWNRTKPGFVPYQIQIGQVSNGATLGPQHELFFKSGSAANGEKQQAEWVFRNIRFYEEGSPDPGPITFAPSKFSVRPQLLTKKPAFSAATAPLTTVSETAPPVPAKPPPPPKPAPSSTVRVEDNGHAVHLRDAPTVNYPLDYTITPKTIMAFDLDVIDTSKVGRENGIGLSPDASAANSEDSPRYFHFLGGHASNDPRAGFSDPSLGAYPYPTYKPNTLYTDSIPLSPVKGTQAKTLSTTFLFEPGYYGLKVSEDGKLLFVCNNADNRLEVYDISTDGRIIAKVPIDYPMFVTLAPGDADSDHGTRYVYVDSPKAGLVRIEWNPTRNIFSKPETITPASEFAYPRGLVYSAVDKRIFVCDAFNLDRSKEANQIAVIDPNLGKVLSRFGKQGGVNPATGGPINEEVFTCPLTIDADSKGAMWVNDYYSCETRKYDFDPASNGFKLERRVLGSNLSNTSHFYWLPDAPPTQVWTFANFFVRNEADFDADGLLTNQRATSTTSHVADSDGRPYPHFCKIGDHVYATISGRSTVNEQVGDGWVPRFGFGGASGILAGRGGDAEDAARKADLLAKPGEPPTDLDKAIAASGDANWATRPWAWSDLNGDSKMEYTADNPEFKIDFNAKFSLGLLSCACFRSSDGAYVCPDNDKDGSRKLLLLPPQMVNGKASYDWKNAQVIPCADGPGICDVLAQDERYYVLRNPYRGSFDNPNLLECYDESGKLLWTREHNNVDLQSLQSLGDGMITVMDRGWGPIGPVMIRTKDGDLISQVTCRDYSDCWSNGALRADADTGYIGLVQVYKFTGLATVKSAAATVNLSKSGL